MKCNKASISSCSCGGVLVSPIKTRAYYPDHTAVLTRLLQLKDAVKNEQVTDQAVIRSELMGVLRMSERLGSYYDYCDQISYYDGDICYGATCDAHPIGGGNGYPAIENADLTATDDDGLYQGFDTLKEGQVLLVTKDSVMDLSDFLLGGDMKGYEKERIPFQWEVKKGVTWIGERGVDACGGAILKVTSYTDCAILVGENARLSGLVIQGPDRSEDIHNHDYNLSVGIVVKGNGAVVENCEICGFFRAGIQVLDAENVKIRNNYFHDILSPVSGYAISAENANAEISCNLFANVTSTLHVAGDNAVVDFHDNLDVGNVCGSIVSFAGGALRVAYNTFLSSVGLLREDDPALGLTVENNLFAEAASSYGSVAATDAYKQNMFDHKAHVSPKDCTCAVSYDKKPNLPVLAKCYYTDTNDAGYVLLRKLIEQEDLSGKGLLSALNDVISGIGAYANYLCFADEKLISIVSDGERFGAYSDGDIIGGGYGYGQIFTTGDYIATNEQELVEALAAAKAGQVVFIPGDTYINVSDCRSRITRTLTLPAGVTLASDRGFVREDGSVSTGAVLADSVCSRDTIIDVGGENARITGIVFKGPDPARHIPHHRRAFRTLNNPSYYWQLPNNFGIRCPYSHVEFDNLELCGFNTIAISITNKDNPPKDCSVHHTYIHHNQLQGLGYGVKLDWGYSDITHNMFNYNRHSISGTGNPLSGFVAENNIEMGESIGHYFDMHGGADRKDGTIISGEYMIIHNNSFLGAWRPYVLRGLPTDRQDFSYNVIYEIPSVLGSALSFYAGQEVKNATVGKNIWGVKNGNTEVTDGIALES